MDKKLILALVLFLVITAVSVSVLVLEKTNTGQTGGQPPTKPGNTSIADGQIILFYGDGCPHCKKVEDFLSQNNAPTKIKYQMKEVWGDDDNQKSMMEKATACGLDTKSIGVPFLWDGLDGKCIIGDPDVIAFFQKQLDTANTNAPSAN